jgi:hypothetical protein
MARYDHLSDAYLDCRTIAHMWYEIEYDEGGVRHLTPTRSVVVLTFRCQRCTMRRYDVWSKVTGDLVHRSYRQPAEYHLPKGQGRRVLMRKEYLRRRSTPTNGRGRNVA